MILSDEIFEKFSEISLNILEELAAMTGWNYKDAKIYVKIYENSEWESIV